MFTDSHRIARFLCAMIFEFTDLFVILSGLFVASMVGVQAWIVHKIWRMR